MNEFIDILTDKIFELCHHHFIKVQQAAYLKEAKAILDHETCIILMDFSGNHSFLVQDAIQSFYWQNQQATLYPFAVYHNDDDGKLKCDCCCVISDHLLHDQTAVHCFISLVIPTICTRNPRINRIKYFSDGAASQFKSFKSLINLMYHEHDFNLKAEHHFFATSHGKSPYDGIGGTIKREAANASLRAAVTNQILTSEQLFLWAKENINGVTMYYVTEEDIISHERKYDLKVHYNEVQTVPGTRSYHCFIPDGYSLVMKRNSSDTINDVHKLNDPKLLQNPTIYQPGKYITCYYDKIWYIGVILECSNENQAVKIKFMI